MASKPCANCGKPIDISTACRFEDDDTGRETLLCSRCCPNCFGGSGLSSHPNPNTPHETST